jgi:mono/diheme cytochrome c family protein
VRFVSHTLTAKLGDSTVVALCFSLTTFAFACSPDASPIVPSASPIPPALANRSMSPATLAEGKRIFRHDTFGNETYWTDTLLLHQAIAANVTPLIALSVGLKVDIDALPAALQEAIANNQVPLDSTSTTLALLQHDAVVGVRATFSGTTLSRVGITCALCHSTVDNSVLAGVGHRLDGWPNRDLNVGAIVSLSTQLTDSVRAILSQWQPGFYDPRVNIDEINSPVVLPGAFGLRHVALETYTGDGPISYWNAYVTITQMHGHGTFTDPRIGVTIINPPDLVGPKLAALRAYQLSLEAPAGVVTDHAAVQRGKSVFMGVAGCASCHYGAGLTDVNDGILHLPSEVGQDATYANRTATKRYRTTPLRGLWNPPQLDGPYFHDGSANTLEDVVDHYATVFGFTLSAQQRSDLVTYLKTL